MVYTLRANGIYSSSKWYIPFELKVYTSRQQGIFLTAARYIPHDSKVYSSQIAQTLLSPQVTLHKAPLPH